MFDADFPAIENIYNLSYFYITFIQLFEKIAVPLQPFKKITNTKLYLWLLRIMYSLSAGY